MLCPHCGQEWELAACPECGGDTPPDSAYCCRCGAKLESEELPPELADRVLCRDGNCIGVINAQGVCGVCGLPYQTENQDDSAP